MKRKEAIAAIDRVGALTFRTSASIELVDGETGENFELDMRKTLAVVRGTLLWCMNLLEPDERGAGSDADNLRSLLACVGKSVALELSCDGSE